MPDLIKLYIRHTLIGFAIAAGFVAALLWFDVLGLWGMIRHDPSGWLVVFILWFFHGALFGAVQFGWAVMEMGRRDDDDRGPRGGMMIPVRVPARKGRAIRR
ncbi:MAG: hypothetical protein EP307_07170 [Rhodobacteraceae bacterium]|nr:MAG: hypothetical protein EP307_07170 [Paracoccaceae bacterium]